MNEHTGRPTVAGHRRVGSRHGRFTTVWPCTHAAPPTGTGALTGWMLNAVVKIVTTYTTPSDRVLLLTPQPAAPRRPGPYAGLHEAAWPVVRLGRGVRTQLAAPYVPSERTTPLTANPELFNAIIAAAEPQALATMRPTTWQALLAPDGVLAVLTHGQHTPARFHDPGTALVRTGRVDGLRYLDRIAVLHASVERTSPNPIRAHADLHIFSTDTGAGA